MIKTQATAAQQRGTIVEGLRQGLRLDVAAKAAGVSGSTAGAWFTEGQAARGREEDGHALDAADHLLAEFAGEVETAEAEFECQLVREVRDSGPTWARAAWLLERRFPARWSGRVHETLAKERDELLAGIKGSLDELTFRRVVEAASKAWPAKRSTTRAGVAGEPARGMTFPSEENALATLDETRAAPIARKERSDGGGR